MTLDDSVRDRLILVGGKVAGVDCPNCPFKSRDLELDPLSFIPVSCPECGTTIITEEEKSELRRAHKF